MTEPAADSLYRAAFRGMDTPALLTDTSFVISDVNEAGLEFVGYEYGELVGEHVSIVASDDDVIGSVIENLHQGTSWRGQFPLRTRTEDVVYGRGSASPLVVDGDLEGYVAVFIDVTDRYRYERTTRVLNRLLRHDLRNEVNVAVAELETAESTVDDSDATAAIDRAVDTLTDIVEQSQRARDLQEILERDYDGTIHPYRLDRAIEEAIDDLVAGDDASQIHVDDVPATSVLGDSLLSTVFSVILENAVEHNDSPSPRVAVTVERPDDDSIVVAVADNGPGIPDGAKDLVFGREERDPLHHGSGISLFFADAAVDSYGGSVWVESNDDGGTTVRVRLPVAEQN